jgi:hypothetical protein
MSCDQLQKSIEAFRNLIQLEAKKAPKDEEAQKVAVLVSLGLVLLESTLSDIKRIVDALDQIVMNTQQRP